MTIKKKVLVFLALPLLASSVLLFGCVKKPVDLSISHAHEGRHAYKKLPDGSFLVWVASDVDLEIVRKELTCPCTLGPMNGKFYIIEPLVKDNNNNNNTTQKTKEKP